MKRADFWDVVLCSLAMALLMDAVSISGMSVGIY
jgi:hypothetical protein